MKLKHRKPIFMAIAICGSFAISIVALSLIAELYMILFESGENPFRDSPGYVRGKCGFFDEDGVKVRYTWGNRVENNQFFFRDDDVVTPKPTGVFRIVVVGDSFTWSTGLPISKGYTHLLEEMLNNDLSHDSANNIQIDVVTFSRGGGYIGHYYNFINDYHEAVEPDLIVMGMCYNDPNVKGFADEGTRDEYKDNIIPKYTAPLKKLNYLGSRFLKSRLSRDGVFGLLETLDVIPDPVEANWIAGYEDGTKNWQNFIDTLKSIHDLSLKITSRKPVLITLMAPGGAHRKSYYDPPGHQEALIAKMFKKARKAAEDTGFITVDTLPAFKKKLNGKYLALNEDDAHPNELCQQVYAEVLHHALIGLKDELSLPIKGNDKRKQQ